LVTRKFQVIGRLIIMDDITERVDLESQLSQADKLSSIGLLAAGVAAHLIGGAVVSAHANWFLLLLFLAFSLSWFGMYRELPPG